MPHRASSPTGSEFEYDISNALADGSFLGDDDEFVGTGDGPQPKSISSGFDANDVLEDEGDSGDDDWAFIAAQQAASNKKGGGAVKGKTAKKGGGFQAMGLGLPLLKAITRKGFKVPTPIQRKAIPLILDGQDVVGMARTGSGKTAAFVIPMIERLKAHSAKVGARALILSPSRELALQTLKVVKEFGKGTDLKSILLVGGDSLEDQFGFMAGNPDIIIATPGRFLHLKVEMDLDLKSIQYVVFDEADRLFEMGFSAQLTEILYALPSSRQTLLFSATLPTLLVEFAKAGLQEPSLVRLDADAKVSLELESAFFSVKTSEKEGALLHILQDIIKIPRGQPEKKSEDSESKGKKRKRPAGTAAHEAPSSHSTIIFAATKHHVEYLARLISLAGFAVSYVYGSLDQVARRNQVARFRAGETKILVVTDVAARGIDIPVLANVINYDFPPQPKVFVHRVGRTARAGRKGWSYNIVKAEDIPYLIDLQLFLGRKLVFASEKDQNPRRDFDFAADMVVGGLMRDQVERCVEWANRLLDEDSEASALRAVAVKGEKLYLKTRSSASAESVKRAKEVVAQKSWSMVNPLFADDVNNAELERARMLARVSNFRPPETIFEIGQRGLNRSEAAAIMRKRREKIKIDPSRRNSTAGDSDVESVGLSDNGEALENEIEALNLSEASEDEIEKAFTNRTKKQKRKQRLTTFEDSEHFMSYNPTTSLAEDRGYSVTGSFAEAARGATMDLTNDDGGKGFAEAHKAKGLRWDKKAKKYIHRVNDEDGSRGAKMIIGESGQKIAASFKSGRFESWKSAHKLSRLPRTGEVETSGAESRFSGPGGAGKVVMGGKSGGKMFHTSVKAPKPADKARDDYRVRKKRFEEAKEKGLVKSKVKSELKSKEQIRKDKKIKQRRREKNARPSRKVLGSRIR